MKAITNIVRTFDSSHVFKTCGISLPGITGVFFPGTRRIYQIQSCAVPRIDALDFRIERNNGLRRIGYHETKRRIVAQPAAPLAYGQAAIPNCHPRRETMGLQALCNKVFDLDYRRS